MKKYIISLSVALVMFTGSLFVINQVQATEMTVTDFINLLIKIGVIAPDKVPAANAYLATLVDGVTKPIPLACVTEGKTVTGPVAPEYSTHCCPDLFAQYPNDGRVGGSGVCVRPQTSPLTVLSPNGGETWFC